MRRWDSKPRHSDGDWRLVRNYYFHSKLYRRSWTIERFLGVFSGFSTWEVPRRQLSATAVIRMQWCCLGGCQLQTGI
jgi:hypothetical protein